MAAWLAVVALVCAVCVLVYVYMWVTFRRIWSMGDKIPGPKVDNRLLGNTSMFMGKSDLYFPILMKLHDDFGPVVRLWLGPNLLVMLKDPADVQKVLGDKDVRNRPLNITTVLVRVLGPGLSTHRDDHWMLTRKLFTPTFHVKVLESFVVEFGQNARGLADKLKTVSDGQVVNLAHHVMAFAMKSLCNTIMGSSKRGTFQDIDGYIEELQNLNTLIMDLISRPWLLLLPQVFKMTSYGRKAEKFKQVSEAFSSWVVSRKISDNKEGTSAPRISTSGDRKIQNFMDAMMDATEDGKPAFSLHDIKHEVIDFTGAAIGTSSLTVIFTLMMLALDPKIQAEVHKELDDVFGSDSRTATYEDIQKLSLLDRCIKETLRLFPATSTNPREISKDILLPSGYVLPAGCQVMNFAFAIHRDPRYFPDPEKYYPDRWLPENMKNIHPCAYIPFSVGPRDCIGKKYAQLQMKSVLSQLLREFVFHPVLDMKTILDKLRISVAAYLDEETGYPLRFTCRQ